MTIDFSQYFDPQHIDKIIRIAVIIVLGSSLIYGISSSVRRSLAKKLSKQSMMLVNRTILYTGFTGLIMLILKELNIELTALLGAAGVVGIVLGVASQTSIGNIISGLFLISEKPFELGDIVRIGDKSGTVYSIDLLSIKIRTFDNLMLRIPNQTVISSDVINVTKFPIRRLDIMIGVAYKEDLRKVQSILENVAKNNPLCLEEPEPMILFETFGNSSIDIKFAVWFEKGNFQKVKNSVFIEIKEAFDREGIEIPFPHISVYAGETTKPMPFKVVNEAGELDK